jgi:2-methylisocitrate lyase-like PEP mutase family enzyme
MTSTVTEKRRAFARLHEQGCFTLPNPWDIGSLRRLERLGFAAVASTSSGLAWSLGLEDHQVSLDAVLAHLRHLSGATDLPVNADFENGYADAPEDVARNVALAADTGVAGLSIEDWGAGTLYERSLAVERMQAARAALDRSAPDVLLVGRCDSFLHGETAIGRVIERLVAYAEAGADCLYAPGLKAPAHIKAVVEAVAPKPVNVLLFSPEMTVPALAELGVRRVSVGGRLAAAAWRGFDAAAQHLAESGAMPAALYQHP